MNLPNTIEELLALDWPIKPYEGYISITYTALAGYKVNICYYIYTSSDKAKPKHRIVYSEDNCVEALHLLWEQVLIDAQNFKNDLNVPVEVRSCFRRLARDNKVSKAAVFSRQS